MIPYVRKSFYKHYKDGIKYICDREDLNVTKEECVNVSIDDKTIYDCEKAYDYAMDMTVKETEQAVEGLFHNLK